MQAEADNRDIIARYQQLELRLTHAEAELDTTRRSEEGRNLQLQVSPLCRIQTANTFFSALPSLTTCLPLPLCSFQRALADVQQLGSTVHEQLAAIRQLEAANKKLTSEAEVALARAEKVQQNESMVELLRQALAGLQEDRRSMQV